MSTGETPVLHLSLGTDAETNRNWQILDDTMHRLARGVQIPDDLSILGSLDVRDNLTVGGDATIGGALSANSVQGITLTAGTGGLLSTGPIHGQNGLQIDAGPIVFPDRSLDGADFQKNAPIQTVAVGAPITTFTNLVVGTPLEFGHVDLTASEDVGRWSLVVAQGTYRITYGPAGAPSITLTMEIRRGPSTVQTRVFGYGKNTGGDDLVVDVPLTMVRLAQPTDTNRQWSLWGTTSGLVGGMSVSRVFGQLHCIQFR